jgi:ATP-dependent DNA helicase RecQ
MSLIAFFDLEISLEEKTILDIGSIRSDDAEFHHGHPSKFFDFISRADFLCGHNIISHDLKYLQKYKGDSNFGLERAIDTLLISPLLFPKKPYHGLLKDDKLQTEELNNPLNDSKKARNLFYDEVNAFRQLLENFKMILYGLIVQSTGFACFFKYLEYHND